MCDHAILFSPIILDVGDVFGLINLVPAMDHTLKLLRKRFAKSPELRVYSTQGGFAKLVGRSEGYIRNVENGVVPLSLKLAEAVEEKTGVSAKWLLKPGKPDSVSPPSKPDGKDWEPAVAIRLIKAEIDTGKQALTQLIAEATRTGTSMPDLIGGLVKTALEADLARGSFDLLVEIANLLRDNGHMQFSPAPENKP
jgi:transcriptional regulator with XRE-family HTH domain